MSTVRLALGVPALPELLEDRAVALVPGAILGSLIEHLQFSSKPLLLVGLVVAQIVGGTLLGPVYGLLRWRQPVAALDAVLFGGLMWLALETLVAVWGAGPQAAARSEVLLFVGGVVYGFGLEGVAVLLQPPMTGVAPGGVDRRRLLALGGVMAGGALVAVGNLGRFVATVAQQEAPPREAEPVAAAAPTTPSPTRPTIPTPTTAAVVQATLEPSVKPAATAVPTPKMSALLNLPDEITPNERFYLVSKNFIDPVIRAQEWRLEVRGLVERPRQFTYEELLTAAGATQITTLGCISNPVGGKLLSTAQWVGVPLAQILRDARVSDKATAVRVHAVDAYEESYPLELAMMPTTLLAYRMNGAPLPEKHGFPLRLVVPGHYGMKSTKWVVGIEVSDEQPDGYWEQRGWDRQAIVQTISRIDAPLDQATVHGPRVLMGGVAFAGTRGISRVEVSLDGGASWQPAQVNRALAAGVWHQWIFAWNDPAVGRQRVLVRAVDGDGDPQASADRPPFPAGSTGYHRVQIQVQGV